MSEERNIEKQLRAAAEQRRQEAGAPFEMHPATRRMLHGEIQRVHGPKTTSLGGRNPIFAGLWLRFAAGVCTVGILLVATWVMFFHTPPPKSQQLAKNEVRRASETAGYVQNSASKAERADAPAEAKSEPLAKAKPLPPGVTAGYVQSAMPLAAPRAEAPAKPARVAADFSNDGSQMAAAQPAAPLPPASTMSGVLAESSPVQNLRYLNNAAVAAGGARKKDTLAPLLATKTLDNVAAAKVAGATAMLNSFQVEQRGEELRIIDGDGSVYTGRLLAQAGQDKEARLNFADRAKQRQVAANGLAGNLQNAPFNATGTNLSLKQNVTINAAFVNGSIVGRAVLAGGQSVPLDAAPVSP